MSLRNIGYYLEYFFARAICAVIAYTPLIILKYLGKILGNTGYFLFSKRRQIALDNLRLAFKDEKSEKELRRIARISLQNLIFVFLEFPHTTRRNKSPYDFFTIDATSEERYRNARASGKSIFFTTMHLGNWEFLALFGSKDGEDLTVIGRPIKNQYLYNWVKKKRGIVGTEVVDKGEATREVVRSLSRGGAIGALIDQRAGNTGMIVDFFGKPALTNTLPALMKMKYDCMILPIFCLRDEIGKFKVVLKEEIPLKLDPNNSKDFKPTVEAYSQVMEEMVRQYPEQWLWYHRRWRLYDRKSEKGNNE